MRCRHAGLREQPTDGLLALVWGSRTVCGCSLSPIRGSEYHSLPAVISAAICAFSAVTSAKRRSGRTKDSSSTMIVLP